MVTTNMDTANMVTTNIDTSNRVTTNTDIANAATGQGYDQPIITDRLEVSMMAAYLTQIAGSHHQQRNHYVIRRLLSC